MLPNKVDLCGKVYAVAENERVITFFDQSDIYDCTSRIVFENRADGWYVAIESHDDCAMVSRVLNAWSIVHAEHRVARAGVIGA